MSYKLLLAVAACLPIALSGCGGGGASSQPAAETPATTPETPAADPETPETAPETPAASTQLQLSDVTHRVSIASDGKDVRDLPTFADESVRRPVDVLGLFTNYPDYPTLQWKVFAPSLIEGAFIRGAIFEDGSGGCTAPDASGARTCFSGTLYTVTVTRVIGAHSASGIARYWDLRGRRTEGYWSPESMRTKLVGELPYDDGLAWAGGALSPSRPSVNGTWSGVMIGASNEGHALAGTALLIYGIGANTVDVSISDIAAYADDKTSPENLPAPEIYAGPESFSWNGLSVNADGSFSAENLDGNFYGPNAEEAAGVFERDSVIGAWIAAKWEDVAVSNEPI